MKKDNFIDLSNVFVLKVLLRLKLKMSHLKLLCGKFEGTFGISKAKNNHYNLFKGFKKVFNLVLNDSELNWLVRYSNFFVKLKSSLPNFEIYR